MTDEAPRGYAKGRAKRAEIIAQATALFGEVGYRGASLREIAARCGISHPGLLHHFPTKESLLLAVLKNRDQADQAVLAPGQRTGIDALRSLVEVVGANADNPRLIELYVVLSAEATAADHPAHDYFVHRYAITVQTIRRSFEETRDAGQLREGVDPASAAHQVVAMMDGLQVQWLLDHQHLDMAAVLRDHMATVVTVPL